MPHVILKIAAGKSDVQKQEIADALTNALTKVIECEDKFVSVAIEDIEIADWMSKVYKTEILDKPELIVRQPGYELTA